MILKSQVVHERGGDYGLCPDHAVMCIDSGLTV